MKSLQSLRNERKKVQEELRRLEVKSESSSKAQSELVEELMQEKDSLNEALATAQLKVQEMEKSRF